MNEARIDKYLWAVRIFKTRTQATEACRKGKVRILGNPIKPSHTVKAGDILQLRRPPASLSFQVIAPIDRRLNPKQLPLYVKDLTPPDQYDLLQRNRLAPAARRAKGAGRPTKKDRRALQQFTDETTFSSAPDE